MQELKDALERMPQGQKKRALQKWFEGDILTGYSARILPVTRDIALKAGELLARAKRQGHKPGIADVQIAATALVHGMMLATLNRKDFSWYGVPMVDLKNQ